MLLAKFEKMQKTVDDRCSAESPNPQSLKQVARKDMNLASFSNMDAWVQGLNKQIEQRPGGGLGWEAGAKEPFASEACQAPGGDKRSVAAGIQEMVLP